MKDQRIININVPKGCTARTTVSPIKVFKEMDYVRFFCEGLNQIIQDRELNLTDIRVLLYLYSIMEYENTLFKSQSEIGKGLGIVRQEVSKSMSKLVAKDYLKIVGKVARQNVYSINPKIAFKSRAINYSKLVEQWDEIILEEIEREQTEREDSSLENPKKFSFGT